MIKNKALEKHDKILDDLEARIRSYERYDVIARNVFYQTYDNVKGEIDLLCYDSKFDVWHFYEVKSNPKRKYHKKAIRQFKRFRESFPYLDTRGILYNNKNVYRL